MRYSRIRKKKRQRNYARLFLVGLVLFVIIYVASAGAIGKQLSSIIAPRLKLGEKELEKIKDENPNPDDKKDGEDGEDEKKEQGDEGSKKVEKVSETIKVEPLSIFAIQLGAFSTEENAKVLSEEIQPRGGGGYIIEDQFYRVLAVGYMDEGDTNRVREQLKEQNISSEIYRISIPGANMQVTASQEKLDGVKAAYSLWRDNVSQMEDIIKELDGKDITGEVAYTKVKTIRDEMEEVLNELKEYKAAEDSGSILEGLEAICTAGIEALDKILDENYQNEVVFSSKIKYTNMEMIYIYKNYMEKIVNT